MRSVPVISQVEPIRSAPSSKPFWNGYAEARSYRLSSDELKEQLREAASASAFAPISNYLNGRMEIDAQPYGITLGIELRARDGIAWLLVRSRVRNPVACVDWWSQGLVRRLFARFALEAQQTLLLPTDAEDWTDEELESAMSASRPHTVEKTRSYRPGFANFALAVALAWAIAGSLLPRPLFEWSLPAIVYGGSIAALLAVFPLLPAAIVVAAVYWMAPGLWWFVGLNLLGGLVCWGYLNVRINSNRPVIGLQTSGRAGPPGEPATWSPWSGMLARTRKLGLKYFPEALGGGILTTIVLAVLSRIKEQVPGAWRTVIDELVTNNPVLILGFFPTCLALPFSLALRRKQGLSLEPAKILVRKELRAWIAQFKAIAPAFGLMALCSVTFQLAFRKEWTVMAGLSGGLLRGSVLFVLWWVTRSSFVAVVAFFEEHPHPVARSRELTSFMKIWLCGGMLTTAFFFWALPFRIGKVPTLWESPNWLHFGLSFALSSFCFAMLTIFVLMAYENARVLGGYPSVPASDSKLPATLSVSTKSISTATHWIKVRTVGVAAFLLLAALNVFTPANFLRARQNRPQILNNEDLRDIRARVLSSILEMDQWDGMGYGRQEDAARELVRIGPMALPSLREYIPEVTAEIAGLERRIIYRPDEFISRQIRAKRQARALASAAIRAIEQEQKTE